jgi:hypothetical protein
VRNIIVPSCSWSAPTSRNDFSAFFSIPSQSLLYAGASKSFPPSFVWWITRSNRWDLYSTQVELNSFCRRYSFWCRSWHFNPCICIFIYLFSAMSFWCPLSILLLTSMQMSHYSHTFHTLYWSHIKMSLSDNFSHPHDIFCQAVIRYFNVQTLLFSYDSPLGHHSME